MVKQKVTQEDILINATIDDPILFRRFHLLDDDRKPFRIWFFQIPFACWNVIIGSTGRGTGKSVVAVKQRMIHHKIKFPNSSILTMTMLAIHLEPPMENTFEEMTLNPFLNLFIYKGRGSSGKNKRRPYILITRNGHKLYGLIAGISSLYDKKEAESLKGKHVDGKIIDEASMWSEKAESAVIQSHNDKEKAGEKYMDCYLGVPDGRINTVFHRKDTIDKTYEGKKYKVASWLSPLYGLDTHKKSLNKYGKTIESDEFKQQVRGKWGAPTYNVFDPDDYLINEDPMMNMIYNSNSLSKGNYDENKEINQIISGMTPLPDNYEYSFAACDYGYPAAPTVISIFIKLKGESRWKLYYKLTIKNLRPEIQGPIIDYIVEYYSCDYIGIDVTGPGIALESQLRNTKLFHKDKNYKDRIIPINFQADEIVTYQIEDYNPNEPKKTDNYEITRRFKEEGKEKVLKIYRQALSNYCIEKLQTLLKMQKFALPIEQIDIMEEFVNHQSKTTIDSRGRKYIKYFGKPDHIVTTFKIFAIMLHRLIDLKKDQYEKYQKQQYNTTIPSGIIIKFP